MSSKLITYSSELMSNFKQAEVASAEAKFEALQTDDGNSLLFSVGTTDGVFYVTQEKTGQATGWDKTDLSSVLKRDFQGQTPKTRTFAVAQNRQSGKIDLALVVTVPDNDYLYLSLGNSGSDTGWISNPSWVRFAYDDMAHPLSKVAVVNVFISQASDGEYIVVDALRNPSGGGVPLVFRYYIDPNKKLTGKAWNPHDVSTDIDASKVSSCLGRRQGDRVDGLYTVGSIGGHHSLIYHPLYNPFNLKVPPNPARLIVPEGSAPSAIAAVAMSDNATDLYVACDKSLYYFPSDKQHDNDQGIKVLDHPIIEKVDRLFAFATSTQVIVWGLNRADQVFYTACDRGKIKEPAAWSYPLPIMRNVEQLSPYVNRADNGNTFFAHTGVNQLQKAVQDPETTTWKFENILLPVPVEAKAQKFNSYTTRVQVTDEAKKPLAGVPVNLSSSSRVGVYINNLYYVLDPTPIAVETDDTGGLVIVEWVDSLRGTQLHVREAAAAPIDINPMDKPFQKAAEKLNTKQKLTDAVIKRQDGSTKPLIAAGTSDENKEVVVAAISKLMTAYKSLPPSGAPKLAALSTEAEEAAAPALESVPAANIMSFRVGADGAAAMDLGDELKDFGDAIAVAAGDLFKFLSSQIEYVVHIVKEGIDKAWHFIVEIADKAYRFVLDAAEKIVGALEQIFKAIKTAVEDVIDYLKFLFDWDDLVRTKDVFKHLLLLHFGLVIDQVGEFKEDFNALITKAKHSVDDWAGIKHDNWQPGIKHSDQPLGFMRTLFDYGDAFSSPGMFLFNHFTDNVQHAKGTTPGATNVMDELINRTLQAITDEGDLLIDAANRIQEELLENSRYEAMSLGDVLKKLIAIVVDAMLNTTENVVDLLIDIFVILARAAVAALDTPIWIPVVSDILADFGVKIQFSILDVVCMIGAIPATLVYKGIFNRAPFTSSDGFSDKILNSKDVYALEAVFKSVSLEAVADTDIGGEAQPMLLASSAAPLLGDKKASDFVPVKIPKPWQYTIYMVGHLLGGIVSMATAVLVIAEAKKGSMGPQYETASGVSGAIGAVMTGLPSVLAAPYPIQHPVMSKMSSMCSGATLLGKISFKIGPYAIAKARGITDQGQVAKLGDTMKQIGSAFDAAIAIIALVPTCYRFFELSQKEASKDRTEAIIDETSNVCNCLARITGFAVQVAPTPKVKVILAAVQGGLIVAYGGLQMAEAFSEAAG